MTINIGIIGCGGRIKGLLKMFKQVGQVDSEVQITAMCDPREENIEGYRDTFNCSDAVSVEDYKDLVQRDDVDWVIIGSYNIFHAEQCVAAFAAGKHVFCEKPIAINFDQCHAIKEAHENSNCKLMVGFTLRYSPHYQKIKELVQSGAIGDVISMEFNETLDFNHGGYIAGDWRRHNELAGSHILEKCCHDIDLVNWIIDSRVSKVASFGGLDFFTPENNHHVERLGDNKDGQHAYSAWPQKDPINPFTSEKDIIDNQICIMEFENKVRSTFHTNLNAGIPERRMYINGTEGAIRADVMNGTLQLKRIGWNTEMEDHATGSKGGHGGADEILVDHLYKMMTTDVDTLTSVNDGLNAAITCFALQDAMEKNEIVDMRSYWEQLDSVTSCV